MYGTDRTETSFDTNLDTLATFLRHGIEVITRIFHSRHVRFEELELESTEDGGNGHVELHVGQTETMRQHVT